MECRTPPGGPHPTGGHTGTAGRLANHVWIVVIGIVVISPTICGMRKLVRQNRDMTEPVFLPTPRNITVVPGDRAVLKCRVENLGTKTVVWRRHGDSHPTTIGLYTFVSDSRLRAEFSERTNEWSLVVQDVRATDAGVYHCQISSQSAGVNSYTVRLNVKTVKVTGTRYVDRGSAITLLCDAAGDPEPPADVTWYHDGQRLTSGHRVTISKRVESRAVLSQLLVRRARLADSGVYVCRSTNRDAGEASVYVLNVASPNKRGTLPSKSSYVHSGSARSIGHLHVVAAMTVLGVSCHHLLTTTRRPR